MIKLRIIASQGPMLMLYLPVGMHSVAARPVPVMGELARPRCCSYVTPALPMGLDSLPSSLACMASLSSGRPSTKREGFFRPTACSQSIFRYQTGCHASFQANVPIVDDRSTDHVFRIFLLGGTLCSDVVAPHYRIHVKFV